MEFRTRAQWGATFDVSVVPVIRTPVSLLFVHHNVVAPTDDPNYDMERTEQIDIARFGKPSYDWAIHPSGVVLEGMTTHLSPDTIGHNSDSLSVMFMGNFEIDQPTNEAIAAGQWLVQAQLAGGLLRPVFQILGHRDVFATACPGRNLYPRIQELAAPPIPPPLPPNSKISKQEESDVITTAVLPDGTVVLFVVGLDSGVYSKVRHPDGTFDGYQALGGRVRGQISNVDIKP